MGFELDIVTRRIWIMSLVRIAEAALGASCKFTCGQISAEGVNRAISIVLAFRPRVVASSIAELEGM